MGVEQSISRAIVKGVFDAEFGEGEWAAADTLIFRESGWNAFSVNKSSGAIGLFQFYPTQKLLNKCELSDIKCQAVEGKNYIKSRFGSPSNALLFHNQHGWY